MAVRGSVANGSVVRWVSWAGDSDERSRQPCAPVHRLNSRSDANDRRMSGKRTADPNPRGVS